MPLQIIRQDITKMCVDAIVNTTNEEMVGHSGVDLAVHTAAGPELDRDCEFIRPLGLGTAKITLGYNLPCKYVIHTSGPVWHGGLQGESILLKSCYTESLKLACKNRCQTVAFPLISSGRYGYPKDQVLRFAIEVITEFLYEHEMMVYICVFDRTSYEFSRQLHTDLCRFIDADNEEEFLFSELSCGSVGSDFAPAAAICSSELSNAKEITLQEYMKAMDKSFAYKLFDWIIARGMTDVQCYKRANVDKKTFSKIKCNPQTYKPSKQTAVAFAIALRLNLEETQDLLASAGLTLSGSFVFDKIIRYFILNEIYDIFTINEALFEFDQVLLGNI